MSIFEVALLITTMFVLLSIVWGTVTLGISPMPSSHKARQAMLSLCDETGDGPIYELGSGWGHMLVALARRYPHRSIVGYEASLFPWLVSVVWLKVLAVDNVKIYRQNFLQADLSGASVVVCYLFSKGMASLKVKLGIESGELKYLISHHFALPSFKPVKTIGLNDLYQTPVYLYRFSES